MNKLKELKSWLKCRFETKIYKEDLEDIECIMRAKSYEALAETQTAVSSHGSILTEENIGKTYDKSLAKWLIGSLFSPKKEVSKKFKPMCSDCGQKQYPNANLKKMGGITVSLGKCPVCKKKAGIIPARDWAYACGEPGVMWD